MAERDRISKRDRKRELVTIGRRVGLGVEVERDRSRAEIGRRNAHTVASAVARGRRAGRRRRARVRCAGDARKADVRTANVDRGRELDRHGVVAVVSKESIVCSVVVLERQGPAGLDICAIGGHAAARRVGLGVGLLVHHRAIVVARVRTTRGCRKLPGLSRLSCQRRHDRNQCRGSQRQERR